MRRLALLGLLAASLAGSPADAQVNTSSLELEVTGPDDLRPGGGAPVHLTVTRRCTSSAWVLPEQAVDLVMDAQAGATVAGPAQATFGQQACATSPQQSVEATYEVRLPADATPGDSYLFTATVRRIAQPPSSAGPEVSQEFAVSVAGERPAMGAVGTGASGEEPVAPAVPALLLAAALLGAAVALRRRA